MNNNFNESQYAAMRTAFLTAYPKIFTDIDYSIDIFSKMKALALKNGFSFDFNHFSNAMAIEIEARHKALNNALKKHLTKDSLVIEIASGLSPRHIEFKDYSYAELDFKPIMDVKREIHNMLGFESLNDSLFDVDITDLNALKTCLKTLLKNKKYDKVIILNEGLFWYITKADIENMTNEFKNLLQNYDWLWITSDCPPTQKNEAEYRNIISNSAKVKKSKTFADYEEFSLFFENLNLSNTRYKLLDFVEYIDLTSAKFFSINKNDTTEKLNAYTEIAIIKRP